jgi:hypothetical protein
MRSEIAGADGLVRLTVCILGVFVLITVLQGLWSHWIWGVAALVAAWQFAAAIGKR